MKTAAKIFIILSMIFGFWLIVPLIVGILALSKMESAKKKEDLTVFGILTLIFCSLLGGIFMLCIPETEFTTTAKTPYNGQIYPARNTAATEVYGAQDKTAPSVFEEQNETATAIKNLKKLNMLYHDGIISKEDFEQKKAKYVEKL